jgi:RNA polymerase sigma factor (sigma-70 family)
MHAAELAARNSYGRLLSMLAARTGDLAGAEDALAEAFLDAVEAWPSNGVPDNPDAWLWTAARRRIIDAARRHKTRDEKQHLLELRDEIVDGERSGFPDERLRLLFVCAHPAIDPAVRTPLMLQAVLGLDAARIGSCLRVSPKTMGQRLWRAKIKIREACIPFELEPENLGERVSAVLEAIYAAYGSGWQDLTCDSVASQGLTSEAIWLSRLVVSLLPNEPEPRGLLATMLYAEARASARRRVPGVYTPLSEQDTSCWNRAGLAEAETTLEQAAAMGRIGPFQLEAAIQSAHMHARLSGSNDARSIAILYEGLVRVAPTLGSRVAHAVACSRADGALLGLALLDAIGPRALRDAYQPYWSARAHILEQLERHDEALGAYDRAIGLTDELGVRQFLLGRKQRVASACSRPLRPAP